MGRDAERKERYERLFGAVNIPLLYLRGRQDCPAVSRAGRGAVHEAFYRDLSVGSKSPGA